MSSGARPRRRKKASVSRGNLVATRGLRSSRSDRSARSALPADDQPAVAEGQQQRLVDVALRLAHHVQPGDPQVGRAVLHEDRHVAPA